MAGPSTKTLPQPLPEPAVLIGCFFDWVTVAFTDSPAEMQDRIRALVPATASAIKRENAAKPFPKNVGRVYWSPKLAQHWYILPCRPKEAIQLVSALVPPELQPKVPHLDPTKPLSPPEYEPS